MEAVVITKAGYKVLEHLAAHPDKWIQANTLPNGNGIADGQKFASGETLRALRSDELVEYGKAPQQALYGYRITPKGLQAYRGKATATPAPTGKRSPKAG